MSQYEFSAEQNREFKQLANKGLVAALVFILLAFYDGFALINMAGLSGLISFGGFAILVESIAACFLIRGTHVFRRVYNSEGSDITHLLHGTQQLENFFVALTIGIAAHIGAMLFVY